MPSSSAPLPPAKKSTNVRTKKANKAALQLGTHLLGHVQRVAPDLAVKGLETLMWRPRRIPRPTWEQTVLRGGVPFHVRTVQGVRVRGWTFGKVLTRPDAKKILLVHGWEGRGSQLGRFVEPLVDAGFQVVTFDAPAHGDSKGTAASPVFFADAMLAIERRHGRLDGVVAHSMGSLSTAVAVRRGFDTDAAVFVAPGISPARAIETAQEKLRLNERVSTRIRDRVARHAGVSWQGLKEGRLYEGFTPTLRIFHDTDDRDVPLEELDHISRYIDPEVVVTEGLGHRRILKDEAVIQGAVDHLVHHVLGH